MFTFFAHIRQPLTPSIAILRAMGSAPLPQKRTDWLRRALPWLQLHVLGIEADAPAPLANESAEGDSAARFFVGSK